MKCPNCEYEDVVFSLPADLDCPTCGWKYRYSEKLKYECDKWIQLTETPHRCEGKPYVEVYPFDGQHSWSYLCRWHYWMDILKCKIFRKVHGYCIFDEEDEKKVMKQDVTHIYGGKKSGGDIQPTVTKYDKYNKINLRDKK